jgi:ATP-dependent DNA helicase DinG
MSKLGKWAVIDIETTGIDSFYDQIIDVGFFQFEGTKLIRRYESLVRSERPVSYFIQKLTGITQKQVGSAPLWETVEPEVMDLHGHSLIAHNAGFEEGFLSPYFEALGGDQSEREQYQDSMHFLSLLFPHRSHLKLENFIVDWGVAESEKHRGLQDSLDLLKVLLLGVAFIKRDREYSATLNSLFHKYELKNYWYCNFFNLFEDEMEEIAEQIGLDLQAGVEKVIAFETQTEEDYVSHEDKPFSMEFSGENIKDIYKEEELIRKEIPHYKYRPSQEQLSLRTGQAFKNKVHALVQAPTGTGKTLGYLLPAALFSKSEGEQVLVATGTKTLQQQALFKDVPQLRKFLGMDQTELKIKRMVGSNNHLCELLFREQDESEDLFSTDKGFEGKFTKMYFDLVFYHNARSTGSDVILRDDVPYIFKAKIDEFRQHDRDLAVDFRACTGTRCPFKNECSYINGLREAKEADIIIGNHSLMFSWPRSFPRPRFIVVDEAHKVEEETTRAFTIEVEQEHLDNLAKSLNNLQGLGSLFYLMSQYESQPGDSTEQIKKLREEAQSTYRMLWDHLVALPEQYETYFKRRPRYTEEFWNEAPMIKKDRADHQSGLSLIHHLESIHYILESFYNTLLPYASRWEVNSLEDDQEIVALTRFESFLSGLEDIRTGLETLLESKKGFSHSLSFHQKNGYKLASAPVDVGEILLTQLLETSASVVYTSATLGNAHGDYGTKGVEWATGYSYLDSEKRFRKGLFLPASYDYEKNTKVFLCDDVPAIWETHFVEQVFKSVIPLIRRLEGRTLLLFSARKRFEMAREVLLKEFEGEIPLFVQGMGSNIVEEFKRQGQGILLGMESFGEGIDIPGEALQFVFVDKIPDLRHDLVINERRNFYDSHLGNEFTDYYLSHRARALHQKLGRLLRTESDHGGILVVDGRIKKWKGRTLDQFIKLMKPYSIHRIPLKDACEQIGDFILDREGKEIPLTSSDELNSSHSSI